MPQLVPILVEEMDKFGWTMSTVLVMKQSLQSVSSLDLVFIIVTIQRTLV